MCRCFELYVWPPSWFFPPMGNPVETAETTTTATTISKIFFNAAAGGLRSLLLPLTLASADFVHFSFYVCSRQQQQQREQQKKREIFSLHFSHTQISLYTARSQTLALRMLSLL